MRTSRILALAAGVVGVHAAVVPVCNACKQDECMDSIIKEECGEYLVIVKTPATTTILETVFATVVPTEISHVSVSTTVLNNATTTIDVLASHTIDYTVTLVESETATETLTETLTVTEGPAITPIKRHESSADDEEYDLPEYASMCSDIYQYSSACDCIGFVPSTSTAPAPETTQTITETVTPSTAIITSTIATLSFTRNATTIPVTTTVSTVSVSQAVGTITETTVVTTTTVTETSTTTFTQTPDVPAPLPTYTAQIIDETGAAFEDINIPPGAQIGVIVTSRQTTLPATYVITPDEKVTLRQVPNTSVPYALYYYANRAYSYIQLTTQLIADITGMTKLSCDVGLNNEFECFHAGTKVEMYACGRHAAVVWNGQAAAFAGTCATPLRKFTPSLTILEETWS